MTGVVECMDGFAKCMACRSRPIVRAMADQLAGIAADLLGCRVLRLYQDCAFLKVMSPPPPIDMLHLFLNPSSHSKRLL